MGLKAIARLAPVRLQAHFTAGEAADTPIFVADQDYEVLEVRETHDTAGASSTTADVVIATSGTAPASGTTVLSSALALDSTANTPVTSTLTTTVLNRFINKDSQLSMNFTGTVTAYQGVICVVLKPVRTNTDY